MASRNADESVARERKQTVNCDSTIDSPDDIILLGKHAGETVERSSLFGNV